MFFSSSNLFHKYLKKTVATAICICFAVSTVRPIYAEPASTRFVDGGGNLTQTQDHSTRTADFAVSGERAGGFKSLERDGDRDPGRLADNVSWNTDLAYAMGRKPISENGRFTIHTSMQADF